MQRRSMSQYFHNQKRIRAYVGSKLAQVFRATWKVRCLSILCHFGKYQEHGTNICTAHSWKQRFFIVCIDPSLSNCIQGFISIRDSHRDQLLYSLSAIAIRDCVSTFYGTFRFSECRNTPSGYSVCVQKTLIWICHTNHFTKVNNPNKIADSYRDGFIFLNFKGLFHTNPHNWV